MSRSTSRERTASSSSENERRVLNSTNIKAWDDKAAAKNLRAFMLAVARIEEKFDRGVRSLNRELVELKGSLNALTLSVNEACVALQAQGLRTTAEVQGEQGGAGGAAPHGEEEHRRLSSMEEEADSDYSEEGGPRDHVAMLQGLPQLEPFTGEGNEPFSHWLRRFNDYAEAQEKAWNDVDKLRKLKAYLGGGPREKWDEFTADEKATFAAASAKLTSLYENAFSKDIAKMNLSRCRHRPGESINDFVERLRRLVKAATIGSTNELFKDRFLEEFLDRLDDEIGFHVKAINPKNMEDAVCQAMRFEGLLEARKQKQSAEDQVGQIAARVIAAINVSDKPQRDQGGNTAGTQYVRQSRSDIQCFNCGMSGHIRRDCRKPPMILRGGYGGNNRGRRGGGYRGGYGQQRQYQSSNYRNNGGYGRQAGSYGSSYGNSYGGNPNGSDHSDRNDGQGRNDQYSNDWRNSAYPTTLRNQGRSDSRDRGRYTETRSAERGGRFDRSNSRERRRQEGDRSRPDYERTSGSQDRVYSVETMPIAQSNKSQAEVEVPPQPQSTPCTGCERLKQINKKIEKAANLSKERSDFVFAITEERAEFHEWRKARLEKKYAEGPHWDWSDDCSTDTEHDFEHFKQLKRKKAKRSNQSPYPASKPAQPLKSILKKTPVEVEIDNLTNKLETCNFVKPGPSPSSSPKQGASNLKSKHPKKKPKNSVAFSFGSVMCGRNWK